MRTRTSPFLIALLPFFVLLAVLAPGLELSAQTASETSVPLSPGAPPSAQTTLVIFSDRPMPPDLWPALVAALRAELASGAPETRVLAGQTGEPSNLSVQIIRGDAIVPGMEFHHPIEVFLHGACVPMPRPSPTFGFAPLNGAALGWVIQVHGHIDPFAHVECSRIGQMLGQPATALSPDRRTRLMADAIARVILHEWIHIATQNPDHSKRGISKASFGLADLNSLSADLPQRSASASSR